MTSLTAFLGCSFPCFGNKSASPSRVPSILVVGHGPEQRPRQFNRQTKCRNINLLSIVYAFRPRLRFRLTLGGFPFPRKPWAYGERDSHPLYRYSYRHSHFHRPTPLLTVWLVSPVERSPTAQIEPAASVSCLSPDHYRCPSSRPVSYYALFKWWLLLSQHPGCLWNPTSFTNLVLFRDLSRRSGLFSSRLRIL